MTNGPITGITGRAGGLSTQYEDLSFLDASLNKPRAGYSRPAGALPLYGFDAVSLQTPIFKSWWDGRAAAARLRDLNANTVVLGQIWSDARTFHDTVARLHGAGVKAVVQVTDVSDWVDVREDLQGKAQPVPNTFVTGRATHIFAQARNHGVGRFADYVIIGGEAMAFANQQQRQKMYQVAKQYLPNVPILRRYGAQLERAEAMQGKPHPMGGTWDEYRFGQDECDIALVSVGRGMEEGRVGVRVRAVLEQLNNIVSIVKSRHHEVAVVVAAQLADERLLSATKTAMWSTKEIDQFVSAILTSAAVDGLLFKGLGNYSFDLGHPDFEAQRVAFRQAAPIEPPQIGEDAGRSPAGE